MKQKLPLVIVIIVAFLCGYFVGREKHRKIPATATPGMQGVRTTGDIFTGNTLALSSVFESGFGLPEHKLCTTIQGDHVVVANGIIQGDVLINGTDALFYSNFVEGDVHFPHGYDVNKLQCNTFRLPGKNGAK